MARDAGTKSPARRPTGALLAGVVGLVAPEGREGFYTRQIRRFARAA